MAFNMFGPAGKATGYAPDGDAQDLIGAGTGNGKGPSLGSLWGGAKTADKLGLLSGIESLFGGGGSSISQPKKSDFGYGGQGEGFFQSTGQALYNRAPVQANLDQFNQSRGLGMQSRGDIGNQISTLRNLTKDDQASAAYRQMQAGGQQNMSQALALARAGGGSGASQGAALRQAQMGNQTAGAQLNQQTGIMRAQENAQANQQISGLMAQQRAMDLQASGLDAQTAMQQAQLELGSQQMGMQGMLGMYGLGQNAAALEQKGLTDYWKTLLGAEVAQNQANQQGMSALIGGGAALGAGLLSDEQAKMNIAPIGGQLGQHFGAQPMMFGLPVQNYGQVSSGITGKMNVQPIPDFRSVQPAQPMAQSSGPQRTFGGYGPVAEASPDQQDAADKAGFQDRFSKAASIYAAFQPQGGSLAAIQDPANYLQTVSDARAKKLETENSFLRERLGEMGKVMSVGGGAVSPLIPKAVDMAQSQLPAGQMRRLPMPPRPDPKAAVKDEAGAAEYGAKWLESNRVDAMRDAAAAQAYQARNAQAQAQLADRQRMYAQTGPVNENMLFGTPLAMPQRPPGPVAVTSDEASKAKIAQLEGVIAGLSGNEGGRYMDLDAESESLPGPLGGPSWDTFASVNRPRPAPARHPLAEQATAVPAHEWEYKPEQAAQANVKNGLPPGDPFGRARKTGATAQELARIPATAGAVMRGPDGMLAIDGGQLSMTNLSMIGDVARQQAEQEERLRRMEEARAGHAGRAASGAAPAYPIDDPAYFWGSGI